MVSPQIYLSISNKKRMNGKNDIYKGYNNDERQTAAVAIMDVLIKVNDQWLLDFANGIDLPTLNNTANN